MANRNLSLSPRIEEKRDKQIVEVPISFNLLEIKAHFDESLISINKQFDVAKLLLEKSEVDACKNIWRSQVVFLESILDFYIHELSKYAICCMFSEKWDPSEQYNNFKIPMKFLEKGIKNPESTNWLIEYINNQFSKEVYLSLEKMKDQINLLGLNFENIINDAFPKPEADSVNYKTGKEIIKELFERRNKIAHQLDRNHTDAKQNDISEEYVVECLENVKKLVNTIHSAAEKKRKI